MVVSHVKAALAAAAAAVLLAAGILATVGADEIATNYSAEIR